MTNRISFNGESGVFTVSTEQCSWTEDFEPELYDNPADQFDAIRRVVNDVGREKKWGVK